MARTPSTVTMMPRIFSFFFFLQSRGKLVPEGEKPAAGEAERNVQEQDEPEDHPGPFEV